MKAIKKCPTCNSTSNKTIHKLTISDNYSDPGINKKNNNHHRNYILFENILKRSVRSIEVQFKLCVKCGLIFFSPRPDEDDLSLKYDSIKETKVTFKMEQANKIVDLRGLRAKKIYEKIVPHLQKKSGRVLDIGGADGHCLEFFTKNYSCEILDFENRKLFTGVKKVGETLNDLKINDLYDCILVCHTLEHIPNIVEFILDIKKHLVEDGIIYIEVPFGCSNEIKRTYNLLTHINFFSEGSLGFLLNNNGFSISTMYSGPVLSAKRYLPVILTIAKKNSTKKLDSSYLDQGIEITKTQMTKNLDYSVFYKNIILVLSNPIQFSFAFFKKLKDTFFSFY